ncbi:hypothetical protein N0V82_004924 [Gnomoniopsis sp. IMI 355080]|nr:hypothetical protein N0V82_004924 [Gnomoniopsis sp. IMI 355080]
MNEHAVTVLSAAAPTGVTKKKFAAPPVKRGGPRCRKKTRAHQDAPEEEVKHIPDNIYAMLSQEPADPRPDPISIQNYIDPGAGLKHLEDWVQDSDFIFDSLFMGSNGPNQISVFEEGFEPSSPIALAISAILALIPCPEDTNHESHDSQLFRRKYAQYFAQAAFETIENDEEIPDSAIEPPKALSEDHQHHFRQPFHPRVPVELETVIALDLLSVYEYAQRGNLKKMQNRAGQALMAAMDMFLHTCTIEDEFTEARRRVWWMSGTIVSNTKPAFLVYSPSYAAGLPTFAADPEAFPVYIQAQRAILAATQFVIELNAAVKENADMQPIYEKMKELEAFIEPLLAQSEAWLLTSTVTSPVDSAEAVVARSLRCMASIKLNSARIKVHRYCAFFDIPVFSRKHCDLKSLNSDDSEPRRWPTCSCSTFVNPFNNNSSSSVNTPPTTNSTGLSPASDGTTNNKGSPYLDSVATAAPCAPVNVPASAVPAVSAVVATPAPPPPPPMMMISFPFSSHQSAKICLKSALAIAQSFDELPFPNPTGIAQAQGPPVFLSPTSAIVAPRTMPSFACCAMQCAYALLMVYQKTKTVYMYSLSGDAGQQQQQQQPPSAGGTSPMVVNSLLVRLQQGLTSIYGTLSNYATAFEALGGMRDERKSVYHIGKEGRERAIFDLDLMI